MAQASQTSPKGGVGTPAGFARGAGREWALPALEANRLTPETTPIFKAKELNRGITIIEFA
jgi:hypothetical protein